MTPLSSLRATISVLACLGFLFLLPTQAWSQVDASVPEADSGPMEEASLQAPPPVSGSAYATSFTSETESNYLRGSMTITGGYSNNITAVYSYNITGIETSNPVGGANFSIWTRLEFNKTTSRGHYLFSYSPGYTFYPSASTLNQPNQNAAVDLHYRLSPNATVSLNGSFQQTPNMSTQPNPLAVTVVSGSAPAPSQAIVPPVAEQLAGLANAQLTYQLDANSMIGVSGSFGNLRFPNPAEALGLYNSNTAGGSVFYSRRLYDKYQFGAEYLYQNFESSPTGTQTSTNTQTQTQTQTAFLFLSINLKPTLSLSFSAGPQYVISSQRSLPAVVSWSPLTIVSVGWRGGRTSLAASYARIVSAAGGLNGTFHSNSVTAAARWQMAPTWSGGVSGSYALYQSSTPLFVLTSTGGHTLTGTASVEHAMGEHLRGSIGYSWARQNYAGNTGISDYPNTYRAFISISYTVSKPLQ